MSPDDPVQEEVSPPACSAPHDPVQGVSSWLFMVEGFFFQILAPCPLLSLPPIAVACVVVALLPFGFWCRIDTMDQTGGQIPLGRADGDHVTNVLEGGIMELRQQVGSYPVWRSGFLTDYSSKSPQVVICKWVLWFKLNSTWYCFQRILLHGLLLSSMRPILRPGTGNVDWVAGDKKGPVTLL